MIVPLILFAALVAQDAPIPPISQTGEGIVQGTVKRADNGAPIPDVKVTIITILPEGNTTPALTAHQRRRDLTAFTDASGRFSFDKLPLGESGVTYSIFAERENYFNPSGPRFGGGPLTTVTTAARLDRNRKAETVTMTLIPGGIVSGAVRDPKGAPASGLYVAAMRMTYKEGKRVLEAVKDVLLDDRGQYRLFGLPPGEYYIRAARAARCGEAQSGLASVYFPGVMEPEFASVVRVSGGGEVTADFQTLEVRTVKVSGQVLNNNPDQAARIAILLVPQDSAARIDEGHQPGAGGCIWPVVVAGRFEIPVSRPGTYEIVGISTLQRGAPIPISIDAYTDRLKIDVRDSDVTAVALTLERGPQLDGRVNPGAGAPAALQGRFIGLRPVDTISANETLLTTRIPADGRFQFHDVPEGTYRFRNLEIPSGVYIADIRQGLRSIYDTGVIEIGKTTAESVEIVLATGGARIEGKIQGPAAKLRIPAVSLIPQGRRRANPLLIKTVNALGGPEFTITDIPPGEYKLFAWENLPSGADANAEFMARYEERGRPITITAGSVLSNITLTLIEN
jgi:hypothetical protein